MPIMVLCYNCKNAGKDLSGPEVACTVDDVKTTAPRTRCEHYDPKDGTSKVECDCSSCSFQRGFFILDESDEAGYIQAVQCNASKKQYIKHPGLNCPEFMPEVKA